jgi:hypothetical protein
VGVVAQDRWGQFERARETLGAHAVHTSEKEQPPGTPLEQAKRPGAEAQGQGRECCRASTWPGHSRTRASGKRSLSPCFKHWQLQHAVATRGVSPLSQLRRCLRRAARCCVQDNSSFDAFGSRSMVPAQPRQVPLPSHALSLLAKTTVACSVVGSSGARPDSESSRRSSRRPFPSSLLHWHVASIVWQLLPPTLPRAPPQPSAFHLTLV